MAGLLDYLDDPQFRRSMMMMAAGGPRTQAQGQDYGSRMMSVYQMMDAQAKQDLERRKTEHGMTNADGQLEVSRGTLGVAKDNLQMLLKQHEDKMRELQEKREAERRAQAMLARQYGFDIDEPPAAARPKAGALGSGLFSAAGAIPQADMPGGLFGASAKPPAPLGAPPEAPVPPGTMPFKLQQPPPQQSASKAQLLRLANMLGMDPNDLQMRAMADLKGTDKMVQQVLEHRSKPDMTAVNLGDRTVLINKNNDLANAGMDMRQRVSPDANLSAMTSRRGQDIQASTTTRGQDMQAYTAAQQLQHQKYTSEPDYLQRKIEAETQGKRAVELKFEQLDALKRSEKLLSILDTGISLLEKGPTGSGAGSLFDAAGRFVGGALESARVAGQLKALSAQAIAFAEKVPGAASDRDMASFNQANADIGNDAMPISVRMDAAKLVRDIVIGWQKRLQEDLRKGGMSIGQGQQQGGSGAPQAVSPATSPVAANVPATKPNFAQVGTIIRHPQTGQKMRSNGMTWEAVP